MTTPSSSDSVPAVMPQVLVTLDTQGRVRTSREQRRVLLAEFERSGMSAARPLHRQRPSARRWRCSGRMARLEICEASQVPLAAALIHALTQPC